MAYLVIYLVGAVPFSAGIGLGTAAGLVGLFAGVHLGTRVKMLDPELWTVRQESHPSMR